MRNDIVPNGQMMTSVEIAEVTGKPHSDVMKAIRKMEPAWEKVRGGKFSLTQRITKLPTGGERKDPMYSLTKTECLYVATKFNDEARARLVLRWEELEQERMGATRAADLAVADAEASAMAAHPAYPAPLPMEERGRMERSRKALVSRRDILLMLLDAEDELAALREENERLLAHQSLGDAEATWKVSELARMWGMKAVDLNKVLIVAGIQRKDADGVYRIVDAYAGCGYTAVKQARKKGGGTEPYTVWTDRGRRWMESQLRCGGLLPEGAVPERRGTEDMRIIVSPRQEGGAL